MTWIEDGDKNPALSGRTIKGDATAAKPRTTHRSGWIRVKERRTTITFSHSAGGKDLGSNRGRNGAALKDGYLWAFIDHQLIRFTDTFDPGLTAVKFHLYLAQFSLRGHAIPLSTSPKCRRYISHTIYKYSCVFADFEGF